MRKLLILVFALTALSAPSAYAGAIDDAVRAWQARDAADEYNLLRSSYATVDDLLKFHSRIKASESLESAFEEMRRRDSRILVFVTTSGPVAEVSGNGYIYLNVEESNEAILKALGTQPCGECQKAE